MHLPAACNIDRAPVLASPTPLPHPLHCPAQVSYTFHAFETFSPEHSCATCTLDDNLTVLNRCGRGLMWLDCSRLAVQLEHSNTLFDGPGVWQHRWPASVACLLPANQALLPLCTAQSQRLPAVLQRHEEAVCRDVGSVPAPAPS